MRASAATRALSALGAAKFQCAMGRLYSSIHGASAASCGACLADCSFSTRDPDDSAALARDHKKGFGLLTGSVVPNASNGLGDSATTCLVGRGRFGGGLTGAFPKGFLPTLKGLSSRTGAGEPKGEAGPGDEDSPKGEEDPNGCTAHRSQ